MVTVPKSLVRLRLHLLGPFSFQVRWRSLDASKEKSWKPLVICTKTNVPSILYGLGLKVAGKKERSGD